MTAAGRLVDFLDRRLVPIVLTGLGGSIACLVLAFILVVTAGCGAGIRDDSGTDGVVTNPCAELDTPPAGCE